MRSQKPKPAVGAQLAVSRRLQDIFLHTPLPSSLEAERAVLGCYLHYNDLLDLGDKEEWFYHAGSRVLFQEMKAMRASGLPVDYILLCKWLADRGKMEEIGGNGVLADILDYVPAPTHYKHYLNILKECSLARVAVQGGVTILEMAYHHDRKEIATTAATQLALIEQAARGANSEPSMEDQIDQWQNDWNLMASGKKASAMPTRWKAWNKKVMGVRPGYTIIMGARGSGKSILAQNIITDAAITFNRPALIVSYEMPVRMIINRLIADMGNINGAYLFSPDIAVPTPEIIKQINRCLDRIRGSRLRIVHDVTMGAEGIVAKVKQIHAKHGDCVVAVDYLQLMKSPKGEKFDLREQVIAANSSLLRDLSKELDIPVFALSQINKEGTSRESNAPEQDADDIYRIERYRLPNGDMKEEGITCVKNRNGDDGHIDMVLNGPLFRFEESQKLMP